MIHKRELGDLFEIMNKNHFFPQIKNILWIKRAFIFEKILTKSFHRRLNLLFLNLSYLRHGAEINHYTLTFAFQHKLYT